MVESTRLVEAVLTNTDDTTPWLIVGNGSIRHFRLDILGSSVFDANGSRLQIQGKAPGDPDAERFILDEIRKSDTARSKTIGIMGVVAVRCWFKKGGSDVLKVRLTRT